VLKLIGLGLWDELDISLKGLMEIQECKHVFAEFYTSHPRDLEKLEKLLGKKVKILERKDLEEDSKKLIALAEKEDIAILVGGDPLTATTHVSILLEAQKKKIPTKIIHSSSIYSAIAKTGLFIYKFGYTVTLPKWLEKPESVFEKIEENKARGCHSLILIDIGMEVGEALEKIRQNKKLGNEKILVCSRMGSEEEKIVYGSISQLGKTNLKMPFVLVIPGNLHFIEEEALKTHLLEQ